MTKPTVTTLGIASAYFLIFGVVLVYAYITVGAQKNEAVSLRTALAEQTSKQTAARTIADTITRTEPVRKELSEYFLAEKETVSFIAEIESLANSLGLEIETTMLDIEHKDGSDPELKTGFSVGGSRTDVLNFMKALETLPYHSRISEMRFESGGGNVWGGSVNILITMTP